MLSSRRIGTIFLVLAAGSLSLLAACGGDDDSSGEDSTTGPGTTSSGAIGADELQGKIVYTTNRAGNQDIWVMNADGSDQSALTTTPEAEAFPEWSPDGSRIAFQRGFAIHVMNEDGSDDRMIAANGGDPGWSPDGERLVFVLTDETVTTQNPRFDIAVVDVESGEVEVLTETADSSEVDPAWSPDGSTIVFFSDRNSSPGLYAMDSDGGNVRQLTNTQTIDRHSDWSPDGSRIVFAVPEMGIYNLAVISADGASRSKVTQPETYDDFPSWSKDGCCIAFLSTRADQSDVWVIRPDGTGARQITTNPDEDGIQGLDWKP